MTGGTPEHNEIASILNAILRINLRGKPYKYLDKIIYTRRSLYSKASGLV